MQVRRQKCFINIIYQREKGPVNIINKRQKGAFKYCLSETVGIAGGERCLYTASPGDAYTPQVGAFAGVFAALI